MGRSIRGVIVRIIVVIAGMTLAAAGTRADVLQPISSGNVYMAPTTFGTPVGIATTPIAGPYTDRTGYANRHAVLKYDVRAFAGQTITSASLAGTLFNNSAYDTGVRNISVALWANPIATISTVDFSSGAANGTISYTSAAAQVDFNLPMTTRLQSLLNQGSDYVEAEFYTLAPTSTGSTSMNSAGLPVLLINGGVVPPAPPPPPKQVAPPHGPPPAGPTSFSFVSVPGDFVGQGQTRSYTPANATISATAIPGGVVIGSNGSDGTSLTARFRQPLGVIDPLMPGLYDNARRDGMQQLFPGSPGLDFQSGSRGHNFVEGRFHIWDAAYALDGSVTRFAADWLLYGDGATAPAFGQVRYNTTVPEPSALAGAMVAATICATAHRRRRRRCC
jgi:hypothetical protein